MHSKRNYWHPKNQNIKIQIIRDLQTQEISIETIKEVDTEVNKEVVDSIEEATILMEVVQDGIPHSIRVENITKEMIEDTDKYSIFN